MYRQPRVWMGLLALLVLISLSVNAPANTGTDEFTGSIKEIQPDRLMFVMTDRQGTPKTLTMDEDAAVYVNGQPVILEDLVPGDAVRVVARQAEDQWIAIAVYCKR
jgi:hypothetical protein